MGGGGAGEVVWDITWVGKNQLVGVVPGLLVPSEMSIRFSTFCSLLANWLEEHARALALL